MPKTAGRGKGGRRTRTRVPRTDAEILRRLSDLTPRGRREAIRRLLPSTAWLDRQIAENEPRMIALARERGLDWAALSEAERERLVDDILHEP